PERLVVRGARPPVPAAAERPRACGGRAPRLARACRPPALEAFSAVAGDYTDFWLACATAGPVLLIPTYEMIRRRQEGVKTRLGITEGSVAFLGAGTILALVMLSGGVPVHGSRVGRLIETVLIGGPVVSLALGALRGRSARARPG